MTRCGEADETTGSASALGSTAGGLVGEIPSQEELMVQTTHLAREAAELLWETIAFQAGCDEKVRPEQGGRQKFFFFFVPLTVC